MDLIKQIGPTGLQLIRFAIVGLTAAIVHYAVVICLVQPFNFNPLVANVFGFLIAFQLSYWGHRYWTFSRSTVVYQEALLKLLGLQLVNFGINESLFFTFITWGLPYQLSLIIVLTILPLFTYWISRLWIFKEALGNNPS